MQLYFRFRLATQCQMRRLAIVAESGTDLARLLLRLRRRMGPRPACKNRFVKVFSPEDSAPSLSSVARNRRREGVTVSGGSELPFRVRTRAGSHSRARSSNSMT